MLCKSKKSSQACPNPRYTLKDHSKVLDRLRLFYSVFLKHDLSVEGLDLIILEVTCSGFAVVLVEGPAETDVLAGEALSLTLF